MDDIRIKLIAVLAEIDQYYITDTPHVFSIGYCRADGSLGTKAHVRKSGAMPGKVVLSGEQKKSLFKTNVKKAGILMLVDGDSGKAFSLRIDRLTHYQGVRIRH